MKAFDTVLIIDDDPILRVMAQEHFERRGTSQVLHAKDGQEALHLLKDSGDQIDFVLSDINMPALNGVELMQRLTDSDYKGPIVIVSSTPDVLIKMAQELGTQNKLNVVGTLEKPFSSQQLDHVVASI